MSAHALTFRPDGVAVFSFDQPGSRANILTPGLWDEFETALDFLSVRSDTLGLVLASAKPGVFIAGADLKLLANAPGPNDPSVRDFIEQGLGVLEKLESLPFPACAAIDGAALGGGLEVALACDFRLCGTGEKVTLGLPEVTLGLIPGWGGTQRLPRIVGMEEAARMLVSGRGVSARDAAACGLASAVVPSGSLIDEAARLCLTGEFAEPRRRKSQPVPPAEHAGFASTLPVGPGAEQVAARVMFEGCGLPLRDAIARETAAFLQLAGAEESKRLIAAFFASRKK
jgi:enoyl-CoA hydratase/carnithine racemase